MQEIFEEEYSECAVEHPLPLLHLDCGPTTSCFNEGSLRPNGDYQRRSWTMNKYFYKPPGILAFGQNLVKKCAKTTILTFNFGWVQKICTKICLNETFAAGLLFQTLMWLHRYKGGTSGKPATGSIHRGEGVVLHIQHSSSEKDQHQVFASLRHMTWFRA